MAPVPCVRHRCPEYALPGKSRCRVHEAEFEAERRADPHLTGRRGTAGTWRHDRKQALQRERFRCQRCGRTQVELDELGEGESLEVHHVDGDPAHNHPSNLRVLCPDCHKIERL